jgi:hypothetical protein
LPLIQVASDDSDDIARLSVDLAAAERALERTLVQTGVLLLSRGSFEFAPTAGYSVIESDRPMFLATGTMLQAGVERVRQRNSSLSLAARFGLPGDSQLEIGVPYLSVTQEFEIRVDGAPVAVSERTGRGYGDWQIGFAKTLMRESGWRPDLVGRITWGIGDDATVDDGVVIATGAEYVDASLSFVKRRDPLAMFLALGYTKTREQDNFDPGDQYRIGFGTALAVSPESSIFGSLTYRSMGASKMSGMRVAGADASSASLNLGLSTILRRGTLLNIFAELGISDDAPDYSVAFSLPTRW